jgi:hypothetical protein
VQTALGFGVLVVDPRLKGGEGKPQHAYGWME